MTLLRPSVLLGVTAIVFVSLTLFSTLALASPVPENDIFKDPVKAWKDDEVITIKGDDGKTYQMSTRDIILITAGAILLFLIIFCCIGYCLCECVKNLICCICCCE